MPRFVVLEHDHPFLHWDFLLEQEEVLHAWRLLSPPSVGMRVAAEPLADHRKVYLDYEGPVSGNRGKVSRWDHGVYEVIESTSNRVQVRLLGKRLQAECVLEHAGPSSEWTLYLWSE